jgi:YgiT-type zinc finger domain-containing protein
MKCVICTRDVNEQEAEHKEYGISLEKFSGFVCTKCGEVFFDGETVIKFSKNQKRKDCLDCPEKSRLEKEGIL